MRRICTWLQVSKQKISWVVLCLTVWKPCEQKELLSQGSRKMKTTEDHRDPWGGQLLTQKSQSWQYQPKHYGYLGSTLSAKALWVPWFNTASLLWAREHLVPLAVPSEEPLRLRAFAVSLWIHWVNWDRLFLMGRTYGQNSKQSSLLVPHIYYAELLSGYLMLWADSTFKIAVKSILRT